MYRITEKVLTVKPKVSAIIQLGDFSKGLAGSEVKEKK
jgi:hypothetical protein